VQIAIVGAGMSGLVAARALVAAGAAVSLFDKGRTVGGRLATQGREQGSFDHGAQRFSARSEAFRAEVEAWARDGLVTSVARGEDPWWLPVPSTNALAARLVEGLTVRTSARVTSLVRRDHRWWLAIEGTPEQGPFDVVLLTAPAPQSAALLASQGVFARELASITYAPCWALALACDASGPEWPGTIFTELSDEGPVALVVREGLKPGRQPDGALVRLVTHASVPFSTAHLEASAEEAGARMLDALRALPGLDAVRVRWSRAHRWRFARVTHGLGEPCLFDRARGLGVAGDGMLGPRIEAAWESGRAVASAVLAG
jgi:predicted NAD/FAD-dependent oxidoreductase